MKYKNGERIFVRLEGTDSRCYRKVKEQGAKTFFYLPEYVLNEMSVLFSWDEYSKDPLEGEARITILRELDSRLSKESKTDLDLRVIEDMKEFLNRGIK